MVLKRVLFVIFVIATLTQTALADDGQQSLTFKGEQRTYLVRVPDAVKPTESSKSSQSLMPLVLVLHGGGGNAINAEKTTGFTEKAQQHGFIVVYPEGSRRWRKKRLIWNSGHCCGKAMHEKVDDVGFISALIDKLVKERPIDPKKVYVTGMSNGGMMSHRLGIELSDKIAAIAPVVATVFGDELKPTQTVSALMINGVLDTSVPVDGGTPGGRFASSWDGKAAKPSQAQAAFWAQTNRCDKPLEQDQSGFRHVRYTCPSGKAVELYLIKDMGHAWPGGRRGFWLGDKPSDTLNATDVIWRFFSTQSK